MTVSAKGGKGPVAAMRVWAGPPPAGAAPAAVATRLRRDHAFEVEVGFEVAVGERQEVWMAFTVAADREAALAQLHKDRRIGELPSRDRNSGEIFIGRIKIGIILPTLPPGIRVPPTLDLNKEGCLATKLPVERVVKMFADVYAQS